MEINHSEVVPTNHHCQIPANHGNQPFRVYQQTMEINHSEVVPTNHHCQIPATMEINHSEVVPTNYHCQIPANHGNQPFRSGAYKPSLPNTSKPWKSTIPKWCPWTSFRDARSGFRNHQPSVSQQSLLLWVTSVSSQKVSGPGRPAWRQAHALEQLSAELRKALEQAAWGTKTTSTPKNG